MWIILGMGILLLSGCIQATPPPEGDEPTRPIGTDWMIEGYANSHGVTTQQAQKFFQKTYEISQKEDITRNIPARNDTYAGDRKKINGGNTEELATIARENYLQPDFYDTFETVGKKIWIQAPEQLPETFGIFSVPAEQEATLASGSNEFVTHLFVGSGWGTTYFHGTKFYATIEPNAPITITMTPSEVLTGPTFPIIDKNWVERISIRGEINGVVKPGRYVITIHPTDPTNEKYEKWATDHQRIVGGSEYFVDPRGLATLTLDVTTQQER